MGSKYQKALSLYNQGDYEEAFDLLHGEDDQECLLLKAECKKQITHQYVYLIKEALDQKLYAKARHLRVTYLSIFGSNTAINAFQIPDEALEAALEEVAPSDEMEINNAESTSSSIQAAKNNQNRRKYSEFFVASIVLIILFVGIYGLYIKYNTPAKLATENQLKSESVNANKTNHSGEIESKSEFFSSYYEGTMAGFPMALYIEIDEDKKITGQYKNIKYGTVLPLSGEKGFDGTLNIRAGNEDEVVYFTLSRFDNCLKGYGSSGSRRLDVCLYSKSYTNSSTTDIVSAAMSDRLRILVEDWNERHIIHLPSAASLECLYAPEVLFYGQNLSSQECVKRIIQLMNKYDSFSQRLVSDIQYTVLDNDCVRCDFTKSVTVNGVSKNYPAYLICRKTGNDWEIIVESDKQTDAYFERLRSSK